MKNLVIRSTYYSSINPNDFNGLDCKMVEIVRLEENVDKSFDEFIEENLQTDYINLFIPLCIGKTYSDFLGLRLAVHIRSTKGPNQLSNLFIYGSSSHEEMIRNDFFDVLKTQGVKLIDYNLETLSLFMKTPERLLKNEKLAQELCRYNLSIPDNFYDHHSIANIWGMFRLLELNDTDPETLASLEKSNGKVTSVYFKWLRAKNGIDSLNDKTIEDSRKHKLRGLKVLGKISL